MTLAIALVAIFALSQALTFGVLIYFAVQFVRVKDLALDLSDALAGALLSIEDLHGFAEKTETWAESVTTLQGSIVEHLNSKEDD
jgi:hypothetical protein